VRVGDGSEAQPARTARERPRSEPWRMGTSVSGKREHSRTKVGPDRERSVCRGSPERELREGGGRGRRTAARQRPGPTISRRIDPTPAVPRSHEGSSVEAAGKAPRISRGIRSTGGPPGRTPRIDPPPASRPREPAMGPFDGTEVDGAMPRSRPNAKLSRYDSLVPLTPGGLHVSPPFPSRRACHGGRLC
jgi:hypothetical protein